jgi:hypothetical protein
VITDCGASCRAAHQRDACLDHRPRCPPRSPGARHEGHGPRGDLWLEHRPRPDRRRPADAPTVVPSTPPRAPCSAASPGRHRAPRGADQACAAAGCAAVRRLNPTPHVTRNGSPRSAVDRRMTPARLRRQAAGAQADRAKVRLDQDGGPLAHDPAAGHRRGSAGCPPAAACRAAHGRNPFLVMPGLGRP